MTLRSKRITLAVLGLLLITGFLVGIGWGAVSLGPTQIIGIFMDHLGIATAFDFTAQQDAVVWNIRLPRVLMGLLIGAALSVSGLALQAAYRNPLADPVLLGIHLLTAVVLSLIVLLPQARTLFGFGVLHADDVLIVALAVGALGLALALMRLFRRLQDRRRI